MSSSNLVWRSESGSDPISDHESAFDMLTLSELIDLHSKVRARWNDPAYEPCDNRSDALCCDDCGFHEMVAEIQFRLRLDPEDCDRLDVAARNYEPQWPVRLPENSGGPHPLG